jgi:hypothetical protein
MLDDFKLAFKTLSPDQWQMEQVIVFDWHDGPRSGFCKMIQPTVSFYFEILTDCYSQNDTDDHLYQLSFCEVEKFNKVIEIFAQVEPPQKPIWIPSGNSELEAEVEIELDKIISQVEISSIIVQSCNMIEFSCCWVKSG